MRARLPRDGHRQRLARGTSGASAATRRTAARSLRTHADARLQLTAARKVVLARAIGPRGAWARTVQRDKVRDCRIGGGGGRVEGGSGLVSPLEHSALDGEGLRLADLAEA
eukprot:1015009-Prymnesium_polylepis.1